MSHLPSRPFFVSGSFGKPCLDSSPQLERRNSCGMSGYFFENQSVSDDSMLFQKSVRKKSYRYVQQTCVSKRRKTGQMRTLEASQFPRRDLHEMFQLEILPLLQKRLIRGNKWLNRRDLHFDKFPVLLPSQDGRRASKQKYVPVLVTLRKLCGGFRSGDGRRCGRS